MNVKPGNDAVPVLRKFTTLKIPAWLRLPQKLGKPGFIVDTVMRIFMYIFLIDVAFVFLYPFLYMLVTSIKSNTDLYDLTVNWIPKSVKYQNYLVAYRALNYMPYFKNTAFVTALTTVGHLLACSFIGYGFARYKFPGKNLLFLMVLLSIIVPVQTLIVPLYMTFANFKWINTYLPVIVPTFLGFGLRGGLFIFIFRQFYLNLPPALEDAAKIDGCSFIRTYWSIVLPVAKTAILVVFILSVVWHWNDFYEPAIYASKPTQNMLPSRLSVMIDYVNNPPQELFNEMPLEEGENTVNNAVLMAACVLVILPIWTVFGFLQKQFMQGIERTGITGE